MNFTAPRPVRPSSRRTDPIPWPLSQKKMVLMCWSAFVAIQARSSRADGPQAITDDLDVWSADE